MRVITHTQIYIYIYIYIYELHFNFNSNLFFVLLLKTPIDACTHSSTALHNQRSMLSIFIVSHTSRGILSRPAAYRKMDEGLHLPLLPER